MSIVQMLFSPSGRIRRSQYWLWSIILLVFIYVAEFSLHAILTGHPIDQFLADTVKARDLSNPYGISLLALMVGVKWPYICIAAKRWHDRNRTGYIAVAIGLASLIESLVVSYLKAPLMAPMSPGFLAAGTVELGFVVWTFVECGCLDGTKGPNKYGPSPKQMPAPADVF